LGIDTLAVLGLTPERAQGWGGAALAVLLAAMYGTHLLISWGYTYGHQWLSTRQTLLAAAAHLLAMLALVLCFSPNYGWLGVALLFQAIGGMPGRTWLPLAAGVLLVLLAGAMVPGGGVPEMYTLFGSLLLFVFNGAIAFSFRFVSDQRQQLGSALAQLEVAHAALAASAAQAEQLAVLRERARLARAMHDSIGHALVAMNIKLEAAQLLYARNQARGDAELAATRDLIRATMGDLRRALADLRAPTNAHDDLPAALAELAHETQARSGIPVEYTFAPGVSRLPAPAREALWFVAREALANAERHAAAARVQLLLEPHTGGWRLRVADDGVGVQPGDLGRPAHYGVQGMRERIAELGGALDIGPCAGGGTIVEARVPAGEER
jgi:signal transduction histidine kinase